MVFKGSLYILNLLCGIIPCEYKYPFPDTSVSDSVAFRDRVNVDYDSELLELNSIDWKGGGKDELYKDMDYNKTHPLIVYSSTGKIRGYWMRVVGGRKIRAFEGIPYAEPPLSEKRFQAPLPKTPWVGVLEATLKGPKCLQYNQIALSRVIGSENCLYLNIYTPKPSRNKTSTKKFPVLIYLHGGAYLTGSGNDFGPAYLLQRSLILVTINYRLGVMGFLSTLDSASPGNYGLKDQTEAINWVYNNIANFSGDPEKVTLMGHGAGGSSVHFQMISFRARGKFKAGISISGNAFNPWAMHTKEQARNLTKNFANSLRCPTHGKTVDTVACLRKQRGSDLVKMQISFLDKWPVPLSLFRPVVEEEYQIEHAFMTETPEEAYHKGIVDKVPWVCGQSEDEGYTFLLSHVALGTFPTLRQQWNSLASDFLNYNDLPVDQEEITRRVNWLYFRNINPATAPPKIFSDALGTRLIHTATHKSLQAHSQHAETYAFMFGYNGKYNLATAAGIKSTDWGVGHGEILGYILNSTNMYAGFQKNDSELVLSKILVNLIYNFVDEQTPGFTTEEGTFHLWNPITDPRNMSFLHIDKKIKMIPEPYLQQILYWESFGLPDALPLANFTNEIENITTIDENSKDFVSTDVTRTGANVPRDLRPPLPPSTENNTSYGSYYNETEEISNELTNSTLDNLNSTISTISPDNTTMTIESDKNITLAANSSFSNETSTQMSTPESTASVEPTALPINSTTTSASTNVTSPVPSAVLPSRWLAQTQDVDLLPKLPSTTGAPEPGTTTSATPKNASADIFYNLFDSNRFNSSGPPPGNMSPGLSIPILSKDSDFNFVTRSNITRHYLNSVLGITKRVGGEDNYTSANPDEIMIAASNDQYNMYE